ncbi:Small-conductance mechanosensitive channel [Aureimonas jatrophae]|uniref:Small-conductance mechanosensitive channel n=1 Tax=Aureimonas jatrophae TaxID=1166073 RepID=A0A1H0L9X2_9HYPH|nr:Small-conductance mechanosensitive channel [Aureimonas jatrophae]
MGIPDALPNRLAAFFALIALLVPLVFSPARAQDVPDAAKAPIATLDQQAGELAAIQAAANGAGADTDAKAELRDRAMAVGTAANDAAALLVPELEAANARLTELGEPSEGEAPDVQEQRTRLTAQRDAVDSAIKRGRLLAADAKDTIDRLIREINEAFNRDTFRKVASPLSPLLWQTVARNLPDDMARLRDFAHDNVVQLLETRTTSRLAVVLGGLGLALLILVPIRRWLRDAGRNFAVRQVPATRARRSGLALWFVLVGTLISTLGVSALFLALYWADMLTNATRPLAEILSVTAGVGGFVVALGAGLLLVGKSSWRLLPISEETAESLRFLPLATALVSFFAVFLIEGGNAVGVSRSAVVLLNAIAALAYVALIVTVLVTLGRVRRRQGEEVREPGGATTWVTLATVAAWICVAISLVAALQGYANLALFVSRQTIWTAVVAAATYLLLVVADDLCTTLFAPESRLGRSLHASLGLRKSQVRQLGVVLSALLRIAILVLAALLLSGPLGPGASSIFYQFGSSAEIRIGGFTIVPGAILKAAIALAIGITLMRGVRRWLDERYLPATDLDPGARNSVSTIVGYAGIILASFWALTSLGIGMERIALVVSALSVGIGFGLQAITQNFVSGLILLAERPVKIGDTVRIGTDEGDVKRISVRSTEIQIADRSTLIVPNSELITKPVRNMTMANPLGRIQVAFSAPLDVDAEAVRRTVLAIFEAHEAVLAEPAPSLFIDGIESGQVQFKAFAFVSGPRLVYSTRSALLFSILGRFREEGIPIVKPA